MGDPLLPEETIQIHVVSLAVPLEVFAKDAFALEAAFLIKLDGAGVVANNGEVQAIQVQLAKGIGQGQLSGFVTVPLAPIAGVADTNGKPGHLRVFSMGTTPLSRVALELGLRCDALAKRRLMSPT